MPAPISNIQRMEYAQCDSPDFQLLLAWFSPHRARSRSIGLAKVRLPPVAKGLHPHAQVVGRINVERPVPDRLELILQVGVEQRRLASCRQAPISKPCAW